MDLRAAVSHATAELGVRKNFYKFVQEPADHPLFSEAKKVNIEKLRQMPRFVEKNELEDDCLAEAALNARDSSVCSVPTHYSTL